MVLGQISASSRAEGLNETERTTSKKSPGYWLEASVPCCMGLSIGMLTIRLTSPRVIDEKERNVVKMETAMSFITYLKVLSCFFLLVTQVNPGTKLKKTGHKY